MVEVTIIKVDLGLDTAVGRGTGEPEDREMVVDLEVVQGGQGDLEVQEVTVVSLVQTASPQTTLPQP